MTVPNPRDLGAEDAHDVRAPVSVDAQKRTEDRPRAAAADRTRRPNLLVVSPIYPWAGNPPEGIFVHRQIRNLVRLGHQCRVIVLRPAIPGLPRATRALSWLRYHPRWLTWPRELDGVPVEVLFYPQRRRRRGDVVPAMRDVLVRHVERHAEYSDTDVVYAHWLWTGGATALGLRQRFGWPVAAIARGSEMNLWQNVHPFCAKYVRDVLAEVDLPMANCRALADVGAAIAPEAAARIRIAYNGCDATEFRPAASREAVRQALSFAPPRRYVVFCGSVIERKGIAELAAAWRAFAPRHPNWHLVVVGPIVSKRLASELFAAGPTSVRLVGRVNGDEVLRYLQAADGYVQPSHTEGIANATMEAMAVGLPVVTSNAGGQGELVYQGENGWLVPVHDAPAVAEAMTQLASDPERAWHYGRRGRETVLERFDARTHAERASALLTDLARRAEGREGRAQRDSQAKPDA